MSKRRPEAVPNALEVPESSAVNRRITSFYQEMGYSSLPISGGIYDGVGDNVRGVSVFPRGYAGHPGANLFYWIVSDKPADNSAWTWRGANSDELLSRWNMGDGKSLNPKDDPEALLDAQIVLPRDLDVELVFAESRHRLPAHLIGGLRIGESGEAYFDFVDPFYNRVSVAGAVPERHPI